MKPVAEARALLNVPALPGREALRAALMALRVVPTAPPADSKGLLHALREFCDEPTGVAFVEIARTEWPTPQPVTAPKAAAKPAGTASAPAPAGAASGTGQRHPSLLQLDAALPRDGRRERIFLTRLGGGHVSTADRQWVKSLGFADLLGEFDARDCEGRLRDAADGVARATAREPLKREELARYARVLSVERPSDSPRSLIRALTQLSAESFADALAKTLDISDRSYLFQSYPHCLVGQAACDAIAKAWKCTPEQAISLGQALVQLGLLHHVTHEHAFTNERYFYRLAVSVQADNVPLGDALASIKGPGGVAVTDRNYLGKTYPNCWVGADLVDHLVKRFELNRVQAWLLAHRLMQFGIFEHVTGAHGFVDGNFFYRFRGDIRTGVTA